MTRKNFMFFAKWAVEYNIINDHDAMEVLISYMEEQNSKFDRDKFFAETERLANA